MNNSITSRPRGATRAASCAVFFALFLPACGIGTATVASSGGDTTSTNASTVGSSLSAPRSLSSPATISFELNDAEGDAASVRLRFRRQTPDGDGPHEEFQDIQLVGPASQLDGIASNGNSPVELQWNFAADLGGEEYTDDIDLELEVLGGVSPARLEGVAQGNDAPSLSPHAQGIGTGDDDEHSGNIDVPVMLRDTGGDRVRIKVEYETIVDGEGTGYRLARSAAVSGSDPTPEYAFPDQATMASNEPVEVNFRWDSEYEGSPQTGGGDAQLPGREEDVRFRFTVEDLDPSGAPTGMTSRLVTDEFRVDNNEPPIVTINDLALTLSTKRRGKIPIELNIIDRESDEVRVVIQWRAPGEEFPPLPESESELLDLLDNPAREQDRREAHIAKEAPYVYTGRVGYMEGLAPNEIRLPELATTANTLVARGLEGRTIEILRPAYPLREIEWDESPLNGPVASHILGDGESAYFLDSASGGWRVVEVYLETGEVLRTHASGDGNPVSLSVDPRKQSLFIASTTAVFRCGLYETSEVERIEHDFADELRDLCGLGTHVALATAGDGLERFNFFAKSSVPLRVTLDEPWGIAVDPLREGVVYIAERAANRVVALDLDVVLPVPVPVALPTRGAEGLGTLPLPSPRDIAMEQRGSRMLVMCEAGATASLRGFDIRRSDPETGGPPAVFEALGRMPEHRGTIAGGANGMRIITSPQASYPVVGGGVAARRVVPFAASPSEQPPYDPRTQVVRLERALDRPATPSTEWRILVTHEQRALPLGRRTIFIWDALDVPDLPQVQLSSRGIQGGLRAGSPQVISSSLQHRYGTPSPLDAPTLPRSYLLKHDLDSDGSSDIVCYGELGPNTALLQDEGEQFISIQTGTPIWPYFIIDGTTLQLHPAVGDINGDGAADLLAPDPQGQQLSLSIQDKRGNFFRRVISMPSGARPINVLHCDIDGNGSAEIVAGTAAGPIWLLRDEGGSAWTHDQLAEVGAAAIATASIDFDSDGDLDIATLTGTGGSLTIVEQTTYSFDPHPPLNIGNVGPSIKADIIVADIDLDGLPDIATNTIPSQSASFPPAPRTHAFFSNPDGTTTQIPIGEPELGRASSICVVDIDEDGDLDIIASPSELATSEFSPRPILAYTQVAPRSFRASQLPPPLNAPDSIDLTGGVISATITGDYQTSILASSFNRILRYELLSPRSAALQELGTSVAGELYADCTVADIDSDGDDDILAVEWYIDSLSSRLTGWIQQAPGTFSRVPFAGYETPSSAFLTPQVADVDGDGDLEVITWVNNPSTGTTELSILELDFGQQLALSSSTPKLDFTAHLLRSTDIDSDGDIDFAFYHADEQQVGVIRQGTKASYGRVELVAPVPGDPTALIAQDIDGDGLVDFALLVDSALAPMILLQQPGGTFASIDRLSSDEARPTAMAIFDSDSDGDLDLVTNCGRIYTQEPAGRFNHSHQAITFDSPPSVLIPGDLDRDGACDLAAFIDGSYTIFWQTASGSFSQSTGTLETSGLFYMNGVDMGDLDGDGDLDFAFTVAKPGSVHVLNLGR